jgi:hypothetical protein
MPVSTVRSQGNRAMRLVKVLSVGGAKLRSALIV